MTLVDAGPLAAFVNLRDQHHKRCLKVFQKFREPFGTVWPALTEAMYLLADLPRAQDSVLEMLALRTIQILPLDRSDVPRIRELMYKYADLPMDFADAALVRVAERENIRQIFTVDKRDFAVYRLHGRIRLNVIP